MEGTRNEKAVLVALSYFIGGLTAFIWYSHTTSVQISIPQISDQPASVISAVQTQNSKPSIVSYHDGMLEVRALGNDKVLSFNPEITGQQASEEAFKEQGTHVGELVYSVSPSDEYVFFCEQKTALAGTCNPFIYDVVADVIYPVRLNDDRVAILNTAALTASWTLNTLKIDSASSQDLSKPWLLGY